MQKIIALPGKALTLKWCMVIIGMLCMSQLIAQDNSRVFVSESFEYTNNAAVAGLSGGTGWAGPWESSQADGFRMINGGLRAQHLVGTAEVSRRVAAPTRGRLWIAFVLRQDSPGGQLGFYFRDRERVALRIGTRAGQEQLYVGEKPLRVSGLASHLLLLRLDLHEGRDTGYLFVDPGTASEPDIEGATAVIHGDFRFNAIGVMAGQAKALVRTRGTIDDLVITGNFARIARPATGGARRATGAVMRVLHWKKENGRLQVTTNGGILQLTPFPDHTLQVRFGAAQHLETDTSFAVLPRTLQPPFAIKETPALLTLTTGFYTATIDKQTSRLQLFDQAGTLLIAEAPGGGRNPLQGDSCIISSRFVLTPGEALYGLGQFRDGALNLRGRNRELVQFNTQAAVPVLMSTQGWGLFWDNPSRTVFSDRPDELSFLSDAGEVISYYLFTGPQLDDLVGQYRVLTGTAPMLPAWALGYHQSRNKYATQAEVLSVAERMHKEKIPFSSVFIDYFYWGNNGTGSHLFDRALFPDVPGMIRTLHDRYHAKAVLTVWPAFRPGSANYNAMQQKGYLLDSVKALDGVVYDAFNPGAAALYWQQVATQLVPQQIDGWFLDGPEPDHAASFLKANTYYGPASRVRNLFPLVHSTTFYQGLLKAFPDKRPYILTRCAWASQQKNGTAIWSGDIASTFEELKKQVAAGLNFTAAGIPYWTTDIGGYSGGDPQDESYREVFVRWWQYGTFCPIFRSHGRRFPGDTKAPNELWAYGTAVQQICTQYDSLRYRLFPYIYSLADKVTQNGYTPMRLLAFDFAADTSVLGINDQFMYGPSLLVNPVISAGARSRKIYLPKGASWVDFRTGIAYQGGQTIVADAPLEQIPLFVRQGAIIPVSLSSAYIEQPGSTPVTCYIYTGADGDFTLYEDDGVSYAYQRGVYSRIPLHWNDATKTLTLGAQQGTYSTGSRTLYLARIDKGMTLLAAPRGVRVEYNGKEMKVIL
jgi:alpha-D-xyloside xylohydrolase